MSHHQASIINMYPDQQDLASDQTISNTEPDHVSMD